ncbi:hypothetical protein AX13_11675 [Comamonas aquatica DA1877]|uniref:Uncharacterized protein n=1 Tax=Comamonas aquatica DA1877 TaxID=1457173 RepID=A0A014MA74_9BURK|nr:hypothetical protein AX13_11675 [Comamonas aquatica DA1877]
MSHAYPPSPSDLQIARNFHLQTKSHHMVKMP